MKSTLLYGPLPLVLLALPGCRSTCHSECCPPPLMMSPVSGCCDPNGNGLPVIMQQCPVAATVPPVVNYTINGPSSTADLRHNNGAASTEVALERTRQNLLLDEVDLYKLLPILKTAASQAGLHVERACIQDGIAAIFGNTGSDTHQVEGWFETNNIIQFQVVSLSAGGSKEAAEKLQISLNNKLPGKP